MRKYYIDVKFGDNISGDGSAAKPYKNISHVAPLLDHGDEVIVNDSYIENYGDYIFEEPDTIELIGLSNITIRFLLGDGESYSRSVWKPTTVNDKRANLYIESCSDMRIEGPTFTSTSELVDHAHAIRVENSSNITISGCKIHSSWEVDNSDAGELFSLSGTSATISACYSDLLNNSYSNYLAFISVEGNGDYNLFGNTLTNLTSNNGMFYGIWIKPSTRKAYVDGFLAHNIESDLVDHAIGIMVESDNSTVECTINGGQFSHIHTGIYLNNIPTGDEIVTAKHCTFYKCRKAISVYDSIVNLYSLSIKGPGGVLPHEYPPGHTTNYPTYGIYADYYSYVNVLNTICTDVDTVFIAEEKSYLNAEHIVWNLCNNLKKENTGIVEAIQYIRRVSPVYQDITEDPWGSFLLANESPCIDSGKKYGDQFLGVAPDIGALERSRNLRVNDLPALIARSSRYNTKIPLTNIDIEGMIVRGLDTFDPEIKAGREGSALRDMAVKPLTGLLTPYTTELESIRGGLSFSNLENLTEDQADSLVSNVFVTRKTGDVATGIVRIYFESATTAIIPAEVEFISSGGLRFYSIQSINITSEEMALNIEDGLFYVDIIAEAEEVGAEYNIPEGAINRTTSPMPTGVTAVLNPTSFSGGANSESNTELKERTQFAITVRDLVTTKAISYVLPDTFTFIKDIRPIGFRDPEMLRDEILGYHIGGKVDIYIQTTTPVIDSKTIELIPEETTINLAEFGNVPLLRIESIEVLDPLTFDITGITIPENKYYLKVTDPKLRFSIKEELTLHMHEDYVGSTVKVNYSWIPEMKSLQDWVLAPENRVVTADLLVKHFEPAFTSFHIAYYADNEIADMEQLLKLFIVDMRSGEPLQESDIIDYCHTLGAVHVVNPFTLRVETHKVNGEIDIQESPDEIITTRTSVFLPDRITASYLGTDPNN